MFQATFLGHQGWAISTATTTVLIDPLLGHGFGHGGLVGDVYPPRVVDFEAFRAVDAVLLTHEHDDHFDIATLHRINREVPIFLSARSSSAAFEALRAMGFTVAEVPPSATLEIGDLEYRTLVTEHRDVGSGDEWDVLPFVIRDSSGHGSLFSSVDVKPDARTLDALGSCDCAPGIWCYANNTTAPIFGVDAPVDDTPILQAVLGRRYDEVRRAWGTPVCTAIVGTGWSFPGERAWINRRAFPIDLERLAAGLAARVGPAPVHAMVPGQTIVMKHGAIVTASGEVRFMNATPPAAWPERSPSPGAPADHDLSAPCSARAFVDVDIPSVLAGLEDFARFLYGGPVFRALHSAPALEVEGRRVGLVFDLRLTGGSDRCVIQYEPSTCRFVLSDRQAGRAGFVSGYECWAADLLAFLVGDIGPSAFCNAGRVRCWNHQPEVLRLSAHELWMFGQPLRRPAAHHRLYAQLIASQPANAPMIAASSYRIR